MYNITNRLYHICSVYYTFFGYVWNVFRYNHNCLDQFFTIPETRLKLKVRFLWMQGQLSVFKPKSVCEQCGEYFLETDIALKIEKMVETVYQNHAEVFILKIDELVA